MVGGIDQHMLESHVIILKVEETLIRGDRTLLNHHIGPISIDDKSTGIHKGQGAIKDNVKGLARFELNQFFTGPVLIEIGVMFHPFTKGELQFRIVMVILDGAGAAVHKGQ